MPEKAYVISLMLVSMEMNGLLSKNMYFSCKIDGVFYSGTSLAGFKNKGSLLVALPFCGIILGLNIDEDLGPHTLCRGYNMAYLNRNGKKFNTFYRGGGGTITINTLSPSEISGAFDFTAKTFDGAETVIVSEGKFMQIPLI